MMDECMNKWTEYIECVDKYNEDSKYCKPILQEYNECVFRYERMHVFKQPAIITKSFGKRDQSNYWSNENSFVWWSL